MSEEEVKQEEQSQEAPNLLSLLSNFDHAPNDGQVESWKQQHGEVFCSAFSEQELYLWRVLKRSEWVALQKRAQVEQDFDLEKEVSELCVVWSSTNTPLGSKAGTCSTLSEQIMLNSNFMNPSVASAFVVKL